MSGNEEEAESLDRMTTKDTGKLQSSGRPGFSSKTHLEQEDFSYSFLTKRSQYPVWVGRDSPGHEGTKLPRHNSVAQNPKIVSGQCVKKLSKQTS